MQLTQQIKACKNYHVTERTTFSRCLLLPTGSNEGWVKLWLQKASNSPNDTAQHICKAELSAWHAVYFEPMLVGNGQAHATIQCGHCPPPEAENCNPQVYTAGNALGEIRWVILVDNDLSPLPAQNWGKNMCAASSLGPCRSVRNSGWRQSHIIPHLSLAPRKTRYKYIFKACFQHKSITSSTCSRRFQQIWAAVKASLLMGEGLCWAPVSVFCISGHLRYDLW